MFFNTYKSAQMMEYFPLNKVRNVANAANLSQIVKEVIYKNKGLSFIEEPIQKPHKNNYIPSIEKLNFHLFHVHIIVKMNAEQREKRQQDYVSHMEKLGL